MYCSKCLPRSVRLTLVCLLAATVLIVGAPGIGTPVCAAAEAECVMYQDPQLPKGTVEHRFSPKLVPLWIQALEYPQRELKRRAAAALLRAQQKGLTGVESAIEPLMRVLQQSDEDRVVQLTAAQALVALDARHAAPLLFEKLKQGNLDFAEVVEPALARWNYEPMRDEWRQRLAGEVTLRRLHILAIRGLTAAGETESLPRLLELASDNRTPADVRLEAAAALGKLQSEGLEQSARALIQDESDHTITNRLVAVRQLDSHRSADAQSLLVELAGDPQPIVQAAALEQLNRVNPALIMPLVDRTIASPDANVRRWTAEALIAQPSPEHLAQLSSLLDDIDAALRRHVCDAMIRLADDASLRDAVITQGRRVLAEEAWRGREQAILLLVSLDDNSIADQLLALLEADRVEVHTTAAWGLSRLAVPSTAEPIFEVFRTKTEAWTAGHKAKEGTYLQLSHLAQAMGRLNYEPADPVFRAFVPKTSSFHGHTRAAAIWALGHLHANKPDDTLAKLLLERAMDENIQFPENMEVRRMAAISVGRMKAVASIDGLRRIGGRHQLQTALGYAAAWALRELTGEEIPPIEPMIIWEENWFLTPNDIRQASLEEGN